MADVALVRVCKHSNATLMHPTFDPSGGTL
jgi:hypothetical protein